MNASLSSQADRSQRFFPRRTVSARCGAGVVEALERRVLLSGSLSPLATFDGTNGFSPSAAVEDAQGNIFGVTRFIDTSSDDILSGELFEIPAGTSDINVLSTFSNAGGIISPASLIMDSAGNLFGTENDPAGAGAVFEVLAGSNTVTPLAPFPTHETDENAGTQGILTAVDADDNLFGYDSLGNAIEVVSGSGTVSTRAVLFGTGRGSLVDLRLGPDGNLYGATQAGAIVEISPTTGDIQTLASLDSATTGTAPTGITFDAAGNIWGFSQNGGADGNGAVWELPVGADSVSLIGSFTGDTGANPVSRPMFGQSGTLYGLTRNGGANDDGTLFEIASAGGVFGGADTRIVAAAAASADGPSKLADLTDGNAGMDGSQLIGNVDGVMPYRQTGIDDIIFMGELDGGLLAKGFGAFFRFVSDSVQPPPVIQPSLAPQLQDAKNQLKDLEQQFKNFDEPYPPEEPPPFGGGELLNQSLQHAPWSPPPTAKPVQPAVVAMKVKTASTLTDLTTEIKSLFAQAKSQLKSASAQVKQQAGWTDQFDSQEKTIEKLTAQLDGENNSSKAATIQDKITAGRTKQTALADKINATYDSVSAALADITTIETNIQSDIDAKPVAEIDLSQTILSVPQTMTPGKKTKVVTRVTNSGTAAVSGALEFALAARASDAVGDDGDVALPSVTVKIHIKPDASQKVKLSFTVPDSLPAGSYVLLAQLESGPQNLTVGTDIFTVG